MRTRRRSKFDDTVIGPILPADVLLELLQRAEDALTLLRSTADTTLWPLEAMNKMGSITRLAREIEAVGPEAQLKRVALKRRSGTRRAS